MKCDCDNCFNCPYPDCISEKGPANSSKKKPGRKRIPEEEKKQNQKRWSHDYYLKNKEKRRIKAHAYYLKNRDKITQQQKEYRDKKLGSPGRKLANIWVTNGTHNTRIKESQYEEYLAKGYVRGRTLHSYNV